MLPLIEAQPILFLFLNQVTTKKTMYGSSLTSGGGWSLKHNIHQKLKFNRNKEDYEGEFAVSAVNTLDIDKSKLSPLYGDIEFVVNIRKGGLIDEFESVLAYCLNSDRDIIHLSGNGWYSFKEDFDIDYEDIFGEEIVDKYIFFKNKRLEEFEDTIRKDTEIYKRIFSVLIMQKFSNIYEYQAQIIKPYQEKLTKQIKELAGNKAGEKAVKEDGKVNETE